MSHLSLSRRNLIAGASASAALLVTGHAGAQAPEDAAAQRAVEISELEAARDFDGLYDLLHPDAQALIPREVVVGWYADFLDGVSVEPLTVTGVEIVPWTWPVTGASYAETAEVSYVQPFIQNGVRTEQAEVVRLVDPGDGGGHRWFFGRSRAFVDEQIARYASPTAASGQCDLIELGVLPEFDRSVARTINNRGVVAGDSMPFGEPGACGFIWRDSEMVALHELVGQTDWINYPSDINDEGALVGSSAPFEGDATAYLIHGTSFTDLGSLPDRTTTFALSINSAGVIVGWSASHYMQYQNGFRPRAVIWRDGDLAQLPDDDAVSSAAKAINDDGLIAGTVNRGDGDQAVVWTEDGIVPLPQHPEPASSATVESINVAGTVAGYSTLLEGELGVGGAPWIWQPGDDALTLLPLPDDVTGVLQMAINADGIVVGTGFTDTGSVGLIWRDGEVALLSDLIDAGSDWAIADATDINDQNQIVGQAASISNPRIAVAVLLSPRDVN